MKRLMLFICLVVVINISCRNVISKKKFSNNIDSNRVEKHNNLCTYSFKNDSIVVCLYKDKLSANMKFELTFNNINKIKGVANLLLIEDDNGKFYVPEGTFILDEKTNKQYLCDSTFTYNSEEINISFGLEKKSKKRLSLMIYRSNNKMFKNNEYTLYR